ncbi:MAG: hypothetical protein WC654_07625 [Patescibacteria group bacterium]
MAVFAMISAPLSLPLSAVANIVASFAESETSLANLFRRGLSFTLILASISIVLAATVVFLLPYLANSRALDGNTLLILAAIYLPAMPLLVLNSYLHFYHEASGQTKACSRIKSVCVASACTYIAAAFVIVESENFTYIATSYFVIVEVLQLIGFFWLSRKMGLSFAFTASKGFARQILKLGVPASIGLCSQRIFYYLLNDRLASVDAQLVADLSIYMSIMGIFSIPIAAFAQLHSIQASQNSGSPLSQYRPGLLWCLALTTALLSCLGILGKPVFFVFAGDSSLFTLRAFATMSLYLLSGSLLVVAVSQLRAMHDAVLPQLTVNGLTFVVMLPVLYLMDIRDFDIDTFLRFQVLSVLVGFGVLQLRMWRVKRHCQPASGVRLH